MRVVDLSATIIRFSNRIWRVGINTGIIPKTAVETSFLNCSVLVDYNNLINAMTL